MSIARIRAYRVLQETGLSGHSPERAPGARNNEVWFAGQHVLRISPQKATRRLAWEAEIARVLPDAVPHAKVVRWGMTEFGEWLVSRRADGRPLSACWLDMTQDLRREAIHQLAAAMEALHGCAGPVDGAGEPLAPPFLADPASMECPHQLPVGRLLELVDRCRALPRVDPGLVAATEEVIIGCAGAFAGGSTLDGAGLIHGDLHLENVLWDGRVITAILDFEWARVSPPDLDLDVLLRWCGDAARHVAGGGAAHVRSYDFLTVPGWLRERYPALFAHPRLLDRLKVYALAYDIPQLLSDPPRRPVSELPEEHAYHRIRRLVDGASSLTWAELEQTGAVP